MQEVSRTFVSCARWLKKTELGISRGKRIALVRVRKDRKLILGVVSMKIDVTELPYAVVLQAIEGTKWVARELVCDNGRVVLDCAPA